VPTSKSTSPSTTAPSSSAVRAVITRVKPPADGVALPAAGLGAVSTAGAGVGGRTPPATGGLISEVLAPLGVGVAVADPVIGVVVPGTTAGAVAGEADGVLVGDLLAGGVLAAAAAAAGALTATVSAADGSTLMTGLVAASALAVRVTDVTEAPEATGIWVCIWYVEGASAVASDPIVQVADPSPLGQRPEKTGAEPCGDPVSVTDTPDAEPFAAQTCTVYDAAWPLVIPDSDVWTLTHSSGWVEAVGEGVAVEGSGWHCELVAASATSEVATAAAEAAGIPAMQTPKNT